MKKLFLGIFALTAMTVDAQSLSYGDVGVLLSQDDFNGTARYRAMSGAFGALGGDLSALDINPASGAVFNTSEAAFTLGYRDSNIDSEFYGSKTINNDDFINLNQAGAIFVFDASNEKSKWNKFAFGINYSIAKDFDRSWITRGNSGIPDSSWTADPINEEDNDPSNDIYYTTVDDQAFGSFENGTNSKFNISFSAQHDDDLYIGASINTNNIDYYQQAVFEEYLSDTDGTNLLDASLIQELAMQGNGFSFGLGMISKLSDNLRFGIAYKSPTWFNIDEEFVEEDLELTYSNFGTDSFNSGVGAFNYDLRTPGKVTGSLAYVFGERGTISADYTYQNHSNTQIKGNTDFSAQNQFFKDNLQGSSTLKLGTEWRHEKFSFRGGYHFEQSPYKNATDEDKTGFSLGLGYNFGKMKLDLAYESTKQNSQYGFHAEPTVNPVVIKNNDSKVLATIVFKL